MAHVVTEACINCMYKDCANACPVDCFHEGENMMVIDPEVCIDCGICIDVCPVNAILSDIDPNNEKWSALNDEYSQKWPRLSTKTEVPKDANDWRYVPDKFKNHFNPKPGKGDQTDENE